MNDYKNSSEQSRLLLSVYALFRCQPRLSLIVASLSIAAGLFPAAFGLTMGALVGAVPAAVGAGLASPNGRRVVEILVVMSVLLALQNMLATLEELLRPLLQMRFSRDIRNRVLTAVQHPVGITHLEDPTSLDTLSLVVQENAKWEPGEFVTGGALLLTKLTQGFVSALLLAYFFWLPAILLAGTWFMVRKSAMRVITAGLFEGLTAMRRANYLRDVVTRPAEAKEVRLYSLHGWFLERYIRTWRTIFANLWRLQRRARITLLLWLSAVIAAHAIVFTALIYAALNDQIALTGIVIVLQSIFSISALGEVNNAETILENGLHVIPPVLALEQALVKHVDKLKGSETAQGLPTSAIHFDHVHFRYPGRSSDILHNLTLKIPAGKSLAIVGDNGSGKTTLVKLLLRMYDPTYGRITVDGIDLRTIEPRAWRQRFAAIFQDFIQYALPVTDNIGYGALTRRDDKEALHQAALRAGVLPTIQQLPFGWETILSLGYAKGTELSGGQWQRIALARALFAVEAGASVLILDEPTSALDVRAEVELFDRFLELTKGLTTILISHRFSTVRRVDCIVVLEQGQIIEVGTHDELMAAGKHYASRFTLQADRFTLVTTEKEGSELD